MSYTLLYSVFGPATLATLLIAGAWIAGRSPRRAWVPRVVAPLAFGLAFALAFRAEHGWPDWPPMARWEWTLIAIGLVAMAAAVRGAFAATSHVATIALAIGSGLIVYWTLRLPGHDAPLVRATHALVIVLLLVGLEPLAKRIPPPALPIALTILLAVTSGICLAANFAKLAVMAGTLSATCGGLTIITLARPGTPVAGTPLAIPIVALPTVLLLARAYDYNDVSGFAFALPPLGLAAAWGCRLPAFTRSGRVVPVLIVAIIAAVAGGLALWLAYGPQPEDAGGWAL